MITACNQSQRGQNHNFSNVFSYFFGIPGPRGGCASSRLDHGWKTLPGTGRKPFRAGCASNRLDHGRTDGGGQSDLLDKQMMAGKHLQVIHRHQRCGYSNSPFANIYYFYTAGSKNGLERLGRGGYACKAKDNHIILNQNPICLCRF